MLIIDGTSKCACICVRACVRACVRREGVPGCVRACDVRKCLWAGVHACVCTWSRARVAAGLHTVRCRRELKHVSSAMHRLDAGRLYGDDSYREWSDADVRSSNGRYAIHLRPQSTFSDCSNAAASIQLTANPQPTLHTPCSVHTFRG